MNPKNTTTQQEEIERLRSKLKQVQSVANKIQDINYNKQIAAKLRAIDRLCDKALIPFEPS